MKKLFLFCCFCIFATQLVAQSFFTLGANYSIQSYSHHFPFGEQKLKNFKLTPAIGYGYNFNIGKNLSYQPAITLGDLGGINTPEKPRTIYAIYAATLDQFVEYKFSRKFAAGISPSVYFVGYAGITGKTTSSDEDLVNWKNLPGDLNRFVFSAVSRISYYFNNQWSIHLF
jgi:hypothetical protein